MKPTIVDFIVKINGNLYILSDAILKPTHTMVVNMKVGVWGGWW